MATGPTEQAIQAILDNTREDAERYDADYEGRTADGKRLNGIEKALVELARGVDELRSQA